MLEKETEKKKEVGTPPKGGGSLWSSGKVSVASSSNTGKLVKSIEKTAYPRILPCKVVRCGCKKEDCFECCTVREDELMFKKLFRGAINVRK